MTEAVQAQSGRSLWETATIVGLVAAAIGPVLTMLLDGRFAPFGVIFTLVPLVLTALVLTRNRWLIALVTLFIGLYFVTGGLAAPEQYRLAHPEATGYFVVALLELLGSAVATVAGVGVLVRGVRWSSTNRA